MNGDGTLSREELMNAYRQSKGIDFDEDEVDEIIRKVDSDGNGVINYSEWLLAAVDKERLLERKKIEQAFNMFDVNGDRKVSIEEIAGMFSGLRSIDEEAVERATAAIESKGAQALTVKEFVDLIQSLF